MNGSQWQTQYLVCISAVIFDLANFSLTRTIGKHWQTGRIHSAVRHVVSFFHSPLGKGAFIFIKTMNQTGSSAWLKILNKYGRQLSELCFRFGFKISSFLHVVNFSESPTKGYQTFEQSWRHLLCYICLLSVFLLTIFHIIIAVEEVNEKGITVPVILTLVYAYVYVCTLVFCIGIHLRSSEICEFLNATFAILNRLSHLQGEDVTPFSKYNVMVEATSPVFLSVEVVVLMTSMSLYYWNISAQFATALIRRDLLPETMFGHFGWRVALIPLEFLHCCVPACATVIVNNVICIGVAANATVAASLRFLLLFSRKSSIVGLQSTDYHSCSWFISDQYPLHPPGNVRKSTWCLCLWSCTITCSAKPFIGFTHLLQRF